MKILAFTPPRTQTRGTKSPAIARPHRPSLIATPLQRHSCASIPQNHNRSSLFERRARLSYPVHPHYRAIVHPDRENSARGSRRPSIGFPILHYHLERNHKGLDNELICSAQDSPGSDGRIRCRERLGGTLRYYYRDAA